MPAASGPQSGSAAWPPESRSASRPASPAPTGKSASGRMRIESSVSSERCDWGSNQRIDSTVSPKRSSRMGVSSPGGKRSTMPPRTAKSPTS